MRKKRFPYWTSLLVIILGGTASWAFYNVINQGVNQMLLSFGIENFYLQNGIIIFFVFLLFLLLGFGIKKTIDKLIK